MSTTLLAPLTLSKTSYNSSMLEHVFHASHFDFPFPKILATIDDK